MGVVDVGTTGVRVYGCVRSVNGCSMGVVGVRRVNGSVCICVM
jgi:hypothetical protein